MIEQNKWAALFDVDGTMVDNRAYHERAWLELTRRMGRPMTSEYYRAHIHSRNNTDNVKTLFGQDAAPELIRKISDDKEALYRELYAPEMSEIPGLMDLLQSLADAEVPCGAISNSPPENVNLVLDGLDIRKHFQVVLNYTEVSRGKPDPELFLTAAARLGTPIERCVILEDSISGFKAAVRAGAPYVVITAGADEDELVNAKKAVARHENFTTLTVPMLRDIALGNGEEG